MPLPINESVSSGSPITTEEWNTMAEFVNKFRIAGNTTVKVDWSGGQIEPNKKIARLSLGDEHHFIQSEWGKGLTIQTYQSENALFLEEGGRIGIGTNTPQGKLHIEHENSDPNGGALVIGPTSQSNLRLGYNEEYSWMQSHGEKPLSINPLGNNVGIGTIEPEEKLEVTGNTRINGRTEINGNLLFFGENPIFFRLLQDTIFGTATYNVSAENYCAFISGYESIQIVDPTQKFKCKMIIQNGFWSISTENCLLEWPIVCFIKKEISYRNHDL